MLPLLEGACIEAEAVGEFLPAQSNPLAERDDPAGRRVFDLPAGQFDLPPELRPIHHHDPSRSVFDRGTEAQQRFGIACRQLHSIRFRIIRQ